MWGDTVPPIKNIKIQWWIAVVIVMILLYTHLRSDISYIIIGFIVAIMLIFAFAEENGARIDRKPLQVIIAWILAIALIFLVLQSIGHPWIGIICCIMALVGLILTINLIPIAVSSNIIAGLAILLTVWSAIISRATFGVYELIATLAMEVIAITLFAKGRLKEGLLVLTLMGIVVKLDRIC